MDKEDRWHHNINVEIGQLTTSVDHLAESINRLARNQLLLTRAIAIAIGFGIALFIVS